MRSTADTEHGANVRVQLTILHVNGDQTFQQLAPGETLIVGSGRSCGLLLEGEDIEPLHCMITLEDGELRVYDWNSRSGTYVNGERIDNEAQFSLDLEICIGKVMIKTAAVPEADAPRNWQAEATPEPREQAAPESLQLESGDDQAVSEIADDAFAALDDSVSASDETDVVFEQLHEQIEALSEPNHEEPAPRAQVVETPVARRVEARYGIEDETIRDETIDALRDEVEILQAELAERDARLAELEMFGGGEFDSDGAFEVEPAGDIEALAERLEQLLDELEHSDERISAMAELLQASEVACEAQIEERRQLESWVGEIERRVSEREDEWTAESRQFREQLAKVTEQRDRAEQQLTASANSSEASPELSEYLQQLRNENEALSQQLTEAEAQRDRFEKRLSSVDVQQAEANQQSAIELVLRQERLELAQQHAHLARERAEIERLRERLSEAAPQYGSPGNEADHKIRAFREHLREIHATEPQRDSNAGFSSRLAKLWRRIEGRPLDTD